MTEYDDYQKRVMERFDKDVIWLQEHLAPDDVYQFCQQSLIGAAFLIDKWRKGESFDKLANSDPITRLWLQNILGLLALQGTDIKGLINTDFDTWMSDESD